VRGGPDKLCVQMQRQPGVTADVVGCWSESNINGPDDAWTQGMQSYAQAQA